MGVEQSKEPENFFKLDDKGLHIKTGDDRLIVTENGIRYQSIDKPPEKEKVKVVTSSKMIENINGTVKVIGEYDGKYDFAMFKCSHAVSWNGDDIRCGDTLFYQFKNAQFRDMRENLK
jgi:hypothetical protein